MLVVFVGLDAAGKTSIKVYLETLDLDAAKNTVMSNHNETYERGSLRIEVFPGQEILRFKEPLYATFFPAVDKIVFVVDASNRERFKEAKKYWEFLKHMIDKYCSKTPQLIVLAHKQDLKESVLSDVILNEIFDQKDIGKYKIIPLETSIYDPISISLLLMTIHDGKNIGLDKITESLRQRAKADVAFVFDGHVLPISYSSAGRDIRPINLISDVICSLEKIGTIKTFVSVFEDESNIIAVSKKIDSERVIIGVYNYRENTKNVLDLCIQTLGYYIKEIRKRAWGGW
ncbi:MAG: ADP-ribosylation factor-like protein [Candidatus Njordarchaeota archaeon]